MSHPPCARESDVKATIHADSSWLEMTPVIAGLPLPNILRRSPVIAFGFSSPAKCPRDSTRTRPSSVYALTCAQHQRQCKKNL
ncbi:hypothetical protein TRAPUB_6317 [Trametes pubescens]|uniref:Uncharacterized protein n=1 Tax=Trametes pubescens TaxID=154538 RepID=A0A1M2W754_TRAPU|nr:hypothetical protein TRAPUB_6317 [Trametes pubescens]